MILERDFLNSLSGPQLDVVFFLVYGFVEFIDQQETIEKLVGRQILPDRLELMEKMLEVVKKI